MCVLSHVMLHPGIQEIRNFPAKIQCLHGVTFPEARWLKCKCDVNVKIQQTIVLTSIYEAVSECS